MHFTHHCTLSDESIVFDDSNSQFSISLTGSSEGTGNSDSSTTVVFTNDEASTFILTLTAACSMAFSTSSGHTPFNASMDLANQQDDSYGTVTIKALKVEAISIEIFSVTLSIEVFSTARMENNKIEVMLEINEVMEILDKLDVVVQRIQQEHYAVH
ncbi:hypothetical protein [Photobacterium leiognathi]|uniref:hypothetical protein n=1 Tax=Photobacterium leiognathi TaxID=553611 RepID=UPI0029824056|nr:hypothetical protein [Photobacterium leiognathi]